MKRFQPRRFSLGNSIPGFAIGLAMALTFAAAGAAAAAPPAGPPLSPAQQARLEQARQLNLQAIKLSNQGRLQDAISVMEQVLAIRKEVVGEKSPLYAHALSNVGIMQTMTGDYAAARQRLEQALAIRKEALGEKHPDYATSLHSVGRLYNTLGEYATARNYLEQALTIRKEVLGIKDPTYAATLSDLGSVFREMADYAAARPYFEQAMAIERETIGEHHVDYARSLTNLGFVMQGMGDYAGARTCYEQSLAIKKETIGEGDYSYALTLSCLGHLLRSTGDHAGALNCFQRALPIYKATRGEVHTDYAIELANVAAELAGQGDYAAARRYFEQALAIQQKVVGERHPTYAAAVMGVASMFEAEGNFAAARPLYEQSLAIRRQTLGDRHPTTAGACADVATLEAAAGNWTAAAKMMDEFRRIVRRHVASILPGMSEREQLAFLAVEDQRAFYASLSLGLTRREDKSICARSATWLLNGKAIAQESLADRARMALDSRDPQAAATVKQLQDVRRKLATLGMAAPGRGEEQARNELLARLEADEQALSKRLAGASGEPFVEDPWVEIDAVQAALPADGALVDIARFETFDFHGKPYQFRYSPARYVAWIIRPAGKGNVTIVDLGPAEPIDAAVAAVQHAMQAAMGNGSDGLIVQQGEVEAEAALRKPMAALASLILGPLLGELDRVKRLTISPDAALWLVPWGALPLADGRFAIETYQIAYAVSGRDLVRPAAKQTGMSPPVILANPNYDLSPRDAAQATQAVLRGFKLPDEAELRALSSERSKLPKVPALPGTAKEAAAIEPKLAAYTGVEPTLYTEQYALEGVFKAVRRPRAVVLSTHGFFLPDQEAKQRNAEPGLAAADSRAVTLATDGVPLENPLLRCGLLLAGCNSRAASAGVDDGVLTGMEIVGADLRGSELVVLSACETGLGQVRNGEGVAGLRQAFQLAGARAVVATLWQVPDLQSAKLMTDFFTNLAAGQPKAEALRGAQLALIESRREKYGAAHPFFWAAFTLTGQ